MKSITKLILLLALLCVEAKAQQAVAKKQISSVKKPPTISGFAHGFLDGTWLFLYDYTDIATSRPRIVDSTRIIMGKFYLKDEQQSTSKTRYYSLQNKSGSEFKNFWVDDQPIVISGIKGSFNKALTTGSVSQDINEQFERLRAPLSVEIDSLRRNFGNTDTLIAKKILVLVDELKQLSVKFIANNAESAVSLYLLSLYDKMWGSKTASYLYSKFPPGLQSLESGKSVKKFIDLNKEVELGAYFPDFEQPTTEGVKVKLSSFKGKYILLEFWASWCAPCRKENPNLITVYNEYKSRGFEIYGVSVDGDERAWKKAIADDKLPWLQASDLKGGQNEAGLTYGVYEIPSNFLIDPSGKIIAKNLRGKALNKKIKELLGN